MTKVTLVNLNRVCVPPIGPYALDILGSALEADGHEVSVVDLTPAENPSQTIDDHFGDFKPDLVGMTLRNSSDLYFPSFFDQEHQGSFIPEHDTLIQHIKEYVPAERLVLGGVGFSSNPEQLLKRLNVKYGVRGPGDDVLVQLARAYDAGVWDSKELLRGLPFAHQTADSGEVVFEGRKTGLATRVERKFFDNQWYYEQGGLGNIRTSNGCAMQCSYCVEPFAKGQGFNKRVVDDVIYEMDQLVAMGVQDIHTTDSEFNLPLGHSKKVLEAIAAQQYGDHVRLWVYCQPKPFDEEYASLLKKANVVGVNFGTDHVDGEVLQSMKKWYGAEDIAKATALCHAYDIAVMHELLFGYPGDNPDKMFKAIEFFSELDPWVIGATIGLGVMPETTLAHYYQQQRSAGDERGFYVGQNPSVDPLFYVDPSFSIPDVFDDLERFVGADVSRIMIPQRQSTASKNNQLVGSERVLEDLRNGKRGAFWYHYRDANVVEYAELAQ